MYTLTSEKEDRQNRIPAKGLNPNTTFYIRVTLFYEAFRIFHQCKVKDTG